MHIFDYQALKELKIDAEILSLVSEIKEYKGKQNYFINQKTAKLDKLVQIAKIQSTEASNRIEGIITTEKRLKELFEEKTTPKNRDEQEIIGYRDVLNTIHENYEHIPLKSNFILQIHKNLYKYSAEPQGGKFKMIDNIIQETDEKGKKFVRFKPLEAFLTNDAMENLCAEYEKATKLYFVEPLIAIPVFILDFLCIHPFSDGNGRISRLLTLLLLYQNGFEVGKYISLESLIEKNKDSYYFTLRASSLEWHENRNDVLFFVKYMLQIILSAYREFEERVLVMSDKKLTKAQQIKELFDNHLGKLSKSDIKKLLPGISEPMIEKTLNDLTKTGLIKKVNSGKNTAYVKFAEF